MDIETIQVEADKTHQFWLNESVDFETIQRFVQQVRSVAKCDSPQLTLYWVWEGSPTVDATYQITDAPILLREARAQIKRMRRYDELDPNEFADPKVAVAVDQVPSEADETDTAINLTDWF